MPTIHIGSLESDIAKNVLMPGDPKRCEYIALKYLTNVKLVNLVRGMTAYTGYYKNKLVTVFPSGMGNPSMGIYSYELYKNYNVDNIIRIGSCGSYLPELKVNDLILVTSSFSDSNYGKIFNNNINYYVNANNDLNYVIENTSKEIGVSLYRGNIFCSDVFYEQKNDYPEKVSKYNVVGVEMESFALFTNANFLNKRASCLLTVSNSFCTKEELSSSEREKSLDKMIILALESSLKL